jgi:hypothetical protein
VVIAGQLGHGLPLLQLPACLRLLCDAQCRRTAYRLAFRTRSIKTGLSMLDQQVALEFGNGAEHTHRHLAGRAGQLDAAKRQAVQGTPIAASCSTVARMSIALRPGRSSFVTIVRFFVLAELLRELTSAADEETTRRELPAASRARLQPAQAIKAAMRRGRFLFSTTGYVTSAERARRSGGQPRRHGALLNCRFRSERHDLSQ